MAGRAASAVRFALAGALSLCALTIAAASAATSHAPPLPGVVVGTAGPDTLVGTPRADRLQGRAGDDVLIGGGGADNLIGGSGRDDLRGGAGPDFLRGGAGRDSVRGGPGDDYVTARGDAAGDVVSCGPGKDTVLADALDVVAADCERLERKLPLGSAPTPVTIEFLGWVSGDVKLAPFPASVPAGAVPSGGTLTACAASDRYLSAFFRAQGLVRRTGVRAALGFPSGRDSVDLDSLRILDNGIIGFYGLFRGSADRAQVRLANGPYSIRLAVETGGVYTPVMEASVQRACP